MSSLSWERRKETIKRRAEMVCRTYTLKIDKSHLSKCKCKFIERLFLETKWLYNFIITGCDPFTSTTAGLTKVFAFDKDKNVVLRELKILSASMRQQVLYRIQSSIKSLSTKKKEGARVGRLKYKSTVSVVNFKVSGYMLEDNWLKLHKKMRFRVRGVDQIPKGVEYGSAVLVKKNGDYFFKVVTYTTIKFS